MKKAIVAAAAVITALTAVNAAYAASSVSVEMNFGKYQISGIYEEADFNRTALLTVKNQEGEIVCFYPVRVSVNGELDYLLELPDGIPTGAYTFLLSGYDSETPLPLTMDGSSVITYINAEDIKNSLKAVDGAGEDMQAVIEANKQTLRITYNKFYPYYQGLPSQGRAAIAKEVRANTPYGTDIDKFEEVFYKALAMEALKAGEAKNAEKILTDFSQYYSITTAKAYPLYEKYPNGRTDLLELFIKNLTGYANFEKSFNEAAILTGIYKANTWGDAADILTDYKSELSFTLAQADINTAAKAVVGKRYADMDALHKAIADALGKKKPSGGNSSGSRPSSGGSGSNPYVYIEPNPPKEKQPEVQPSNDPFADIEDAPWARDAVVYLKEKGVLDGTDGKVYPNRLVTREEFVKMVLCAFDLFEAGKSVAFEDVDREDWAYEYIACAADKGIITGISSTAFGKGQNIRREDAAVIITRAMEAAGNAGPSGSGEASFTDRDKISEYAWNSVAYLAELEAVTGFDDGSFRPAEGATRAESAQMLYGLLKREETSE